MMRNVAVQTLLCELWIESMTKFISNPVRIENGACLLIEKYLRLAHELCEPMEWIGLDKNSSVIRIRIQFALLRIDTKSYRRNVAHFGQYHILLC